MLEALKESLEPVNLPFTLLVGAVVVYWLLVALGMLDLDGISDGAGAEIGVDDADLEHSGAVSSVLHFLNAGEVPAMIVASVLALGMWMFSLIANHYFNNGSWLVAAGLLLPNLAVSLVATRYATKPFKKLFRALNRDASAPPPVVGSACIVVSSEVNQAFGQAEITTQGAPILINARTRGDEVLKKGDTGVVIRAEEGNDVYIIVKATSQKLEA